MEENIQNIFLKKLSPKIYRVIIIIIFDFLSQLDWETWNDESKKSLDEQRLPLKR